MSFRWRPWFDRLTILSPAFGGIEGESSKQQTESGCRTGVRHDDGFFVFIRNIFMATAIILRWEIERKI